MELDKTNNKLYSDICKLVEEARNYVANTANTTMTLLYWRIGERINTNLLDGQRAAYGKQIVSELATQLSWSHFIELLTLKDTLHRDFYTQMAIYEKWGTKQLRAKIDGMLYERTTISGKPDELIKTELANVRKGEAMSPDMVFKSPYFLDFTGLIRCVQRKKTRRQPHCFARTVYNGTGGGIYLCRTPKKNDYRWRRFLPRFAFLPPKTETTHCNRTKIRKIQSGLQRANGIVSALAR